MADSTDQTHVADILIVDDTPANLEVLGGMLRTRGYRVRPLPSGKLALQAAKARPPDIVLLDIMMPEMDGCEVCRRLKADDTLRDIPVIFISALNEVEDKVKAFDAGGVDYITKPFQIEEVHARVETHLALRRLRLQVEDRNRELQSSYEQLQELEELRDGLVHMIVHDLRSPLTAIQGFLELLDSMDDELSADAHEFVARTLASSSDLLEMVSSLLDVNKMESGAMQLDLSRYDLVDLAREALAKFDGLPDVCSLSLEAPDGPVEITCDPGLMSRVVVNLLSNALKFTPTDGEVVVGIEPVDSSVRLSVRDTGPGIPPEYRERIFEKFGQVEARQSRKKYSTGLGLTFCKLVAEGHGGSIGVDSEVGKGSTFWCLLPTEGP